MDFHDLLHRYFGQHDLAGLPAAGLAAGLERVRVDFGLESDAGRRFGLWALMYILGDAPALDIAFSDPETREAARNFMDLIDAFGADAL